MGGGKQQYYEVSGSEERGRGVIWKVSRSSVITFFPIISTVGLSTWIDPLSMSTGSVCFVLL